MIFRLFRKDPRSELVASLYARIATAARAPGLYRHLHVPDTLEGRFEALVLHMVLVQRGLRGRPDPAEELAKDLMDAIFRDLDASLREMGVGDTSVPKRMKKLGEAFFGRAHSYDPLLESGGEGGLADALARNVMGGAAPAGPLARYALAADRGLKAMTLDAFLSESTHFPPPESFAEERAP
jgi:cytochrome b pre-mRNA-processing protein 3